MAVRLDIAGRRFGRLVALRPGEPTAPAGRTRWVCRCDCGASAELPTNDLVRGKTLSCGCLQRELLARRNTKHGLSTNPLFGLWRSMVQRCTNQKRAKFQAYGGRGIKVCERWRRDFAAFVADIGPRPSPQHTLDRINNDGDYEPGNCRWATNAEQALNRRPRRRK